MEAGLLAILGLLTGGVLNVVVDRSHTITSKA
jgi:hypothetical protein